MTRQSSLAGIRTGHQGIQSLLGNPAESAWTDHLGLCINYKKHFLLTPLDQKVIGFSRSVLNQALTLAIEHTGDNRLQKNKFSIQYAQSFSDQFSIGLRVKGIQYSISDRYGSNSFLSADFGFSFIVRENLSLGFLILNLGKTKLLPKHNERLPSGVISGLAYRISEISSLFIELEKRPRYALNVKLALDYKIHEVFYLRCGFKSLNKWFSMGVGLELNGLTVDTSMEYNKAIGYISSLSLTLNLKKAEPV